MKAKNNKNYLSSWDYFFIKYTVNVQMVGTYNNRSNSTNILQKYSLLFTYVYLS